MGEANFYYFTCLKFFVFTRPNKYHASRWAVFYIEQILFLKKKGRGYRASDLPELFSLASTVSSFLLWNFDYSSGDKKSNNQELPVRSGVDLKSLIVGDVELTTNYQENELGQLRGYSQVVFPFRGRDGGRDSGQGWVPTLDRPYRPLKPFRRREEIHHAIGDEEGESRHYHGWW